MSYHNEIVIALQQLHSKYHLQRLDQSSQLLLEVLPSCNVSVTLSLHVLPLLLLERY